MHFDVVERVELASVIVIKEDSGVMWRRGVDESNGRRVARTTSRIDEEKVRIVRTCTSVGHLNSLLKVQLFS